MAKRVLAIGVGGSGKASITILKERLIETYGEMPENVALLTFDTDDLRDVDAFGGIRLNAEFDQKDREPEFRHVFSKPGVTMDTIFADIANGRSTSYMAWLEKEKLDRMLGPSERDIRGGAQQRRPVGRVALFQRWDNPIYSSIVSAISRIYGEPEDDIPLDEVVREKNKRQIFIIGSLSGGTGSGFMIDICNLVRHAVQSNSKWQSVDTSAVIVLPEAFSAYTTKMNDPSNLKPNAYSGLRELDRFIRTHSAGLPYMVRYGDDIRSISWSTNQVVDHAYLVDTASTSAIGDLDLSGNPMVGIFPLIADFVMGHVDNSTADLLATLRSNAGLHYDKEDGHQYSAFNVLTYIFPVDDVIESFSYRFLRETINRQFIPMQDKKQLAQIEQDARAHVERIFSENSIGERVNPGVIQKAIAATRRIDPESPNMSWGGLFSLLSLSDAGFAQDYEVLQKRFAYLRSILIPTSEGNYRKEKYSTGYTRLLNASDQFLDEYLGPRYDPDNENARQGGDWDKVLMRYREALQLRFTEALDFALIEALNARDPNSYVLQPARLPFARGMVTGLKAQLVKFKELLQQEYQALDLDTRIRKLSENIRQNIAWMRNTKDSKTFSIIGKPEAYQAQQGYINAFVQRMELFLQQRIYRIVLEVLDTLGAADRNTDGAYSVLDIAALELDGWQATFLEVDKVLAKRSREHEKHRDDKRRVRVRRYLTSPDYEQELYTRPEHFPMVAQRVLGRAVAGQMGMNWHRKDDTIPLDFNLETSWAREANGIEAIAQAFFIGTKTLFQVVRENVSVADRIATEFKQHSRFVNMANQINEPFLRFNPASNGKPAFTEQYLSFSLAKAEETSQRFLNNADATLKDNGFSTSDTAESLVACTVIHISRGVKLNAVEQFNGCETDYRAKLFKGRESLHLFPEEQNATEYESRIETLGEPDNKQRPLSPLLVIAMGEEVKLKVFTLGCAFGVIVPERFEDENGLESTEIFLNYENNGRVYKLPLSDSKTVERLDQRYKDVTASEQSARLYLNALQNFVLKATQRPGVPSQMIAQVVQDLQRRGVNLDSIQNPFTLSIRDVNSAIRVKTDVLGPDPAIELDEKRRNRKNAEARAEALQAYLDSSVTGFKQSPAQQIRDMGTVMHLILVPEIKRLKAEALP